MVVEAVDATVPPSPCLFSGHLEVSGQRAVVIFAATEGQAVTIRTFVVVHIDCDIFVAAVLVAGAYAVTWLIERDALRAAAAATVGAADSGPADPGAYV